MKEQLTSYEEYVEQLEKDLLECGLGDFKRCVNCEKVHHINDMYYDSDYCEKCAQYVDACEAERIEIERDADAEAQRD